MPAQCEMIVGFLVPHRCERQALGRCAQCGRAFCEEHVSVRGQGLQCTACAQGLDKPVALPSTAADYSAADLSAFQEVSDWEETDSDLFSDLS
jgi:recombinational DNA repair protein (RecF pathway)